MRSASLCSLAVLAMLAGNVVRADDAKNKAHERVTIDKMDSSNSTITVTMKGPDGKDVEKTLHIADGAKYFDVHGKAAKMDSFHSGDHVLITEKDGKVMEVRNDHGPATITHVDAKKGTVSVKMKDKDGKDVEKTFHLTENAEYFDSTGRAAVVDVFQSGDEVLIVESEGKIKEMHKDPKGHIGEKDKKNNQK